MAFTPREAADFSTAVTQELELTRQEAADSLAYAQAMMKRHFDSKNRPRLPDAGLRLSNSKYRELLTGISRHHAVARSWFARRLAN